MRTQRLFMVQTCSRGLEDVKDCDYRAKHTAIGSFIGSFKDVSVVELGVTAAWAVLVGIGLEDTADVIIDNVLQAGQGMNPARQIAIKTGVPQHVAGQTVNRVCGAGCRR